MKTQNRLIVSLVMMVMTLGMSAQTSRAEWRVYHNGMTSGWYGFPKETVDSIVYTDKNYDVDVTSTKDISDEGRWLMKVNGYGEMSIATTKIGVVAADIANEKVEEMFLAGQLTDLHEAKVDSTSRLNTYGFVVEEGSWKPVVFGFDADGNYRGYYVGEPQTFSSDFTDRLNAQLVRLNVLEGLDYRDFDWGYGSLMHIRDIMGEEMKTSSEANYDHYSPWATNMNQGGEYIWSTFVWRSLFWAIDGLNNLIPTIEKRNHLPIINVSDQLGSALALRAMLYLDAARMYEFMENDKISPINSVGNDVTGLTFPIVEDPWIYHYRTDVKRATREEMATYLTQQLDLAEELLTESSPSDKLLASLDVVYGLKARLSMWLGDYAQAQMYAERIIAQGGYTPLTRDEWLSTTKGFNDRSMSSWMWAMNYPDNLEEEGGFNLRNWASWCCNEYTKGYAWAGAYSCIGKSFYDRMSDTDFRKLSFKAPSGTMLSGQEPHLSDDIYKRLPDYASLKFRPGQGDTNGKTGRHADVPLMRVEEMHFILIEAMAQRGELEAAKATLVDFMQQYRDASYTCSATTKEDIIDEIFLQKRIELWGEGQNYFDYKRLNKPVTRGYVGSNFPTNRQFNTTTRPAWMNFVFSKSAYYSWQVDSDTEGHVVYPLADWNNPDPSDCYTPAPVTY